MVPCRDGRGGRIPYALIRDVIARNAVDAGRHRKLVPARTLRRSDFEQGAFVLRGPRNDAAGVVALWAPYAVENIVPGDGLRHCRQTNRRGEYQFLDHCILLTFCVRIPHPTSAV